MMSKRHNDYLIGVFDDDNVVWESAKDEALCTFAAGVSRHGREGKETVFYYVNGSFNRRSKLCTEAPSLFLIPNGCCFGFLSGLFQNPDFTHYPRSSCAPILFRNSARSTTSACPASISPMRRVISRSQASSVPLSRGASRLWIKSCANSARSASESARTWERRRCRGSAVMGAPKIEAGVILSLIAAPNNGFNRTLVSSGPAKPGELSGGAG